MKKFWKLILVIFLLIIFGILIKLVYPIILTKHTIENYNLSFWCANYYEEVSKDEKVKVYKSNRDSITIEVYSYNKQFLSEEGILEKVQDYKNLLDAMNYEAVLQNDSVEIVNMFGVNCGKCTTEIKSLKQVDKEISIIIPCEEYDLIFSIHGTQKDMNNKNKSVEKIINTLKFK